MKTVRTVTLLLAATLMGACSTSQLTPAEKAAKRALKAQQVANALDNRDFTIEMDYVFPQRLPSRHLDYGYSLRVSGDSLYSYLPYFGQAYKIPYGGGKGLNFSGVMGQYATGRTRKDCTHVEISIANGEDTYLYVLDVFDNGKTSLDVYSRERDAIRFSGTMDLTDR